MEPNFSNFNTGLPAQQQQPAFSQPPMMTSQPSMPSYPNMMTPAVSSYQPTPSQAPPVAPVPTFEPPPAAPPASESAASAGSNPLLRRGRAVDPSIAAGAGSGGYGGYTS